VIVNFTPSLPLSVSHPLPLCLSSGEPALGQRTDETQRRPRADWCVIGLGSRGDCVFQPVLMPSSAPAGGSFSLETRRVDLEASKSAEEASASFPAEGATGGDLTNSRRAGQS
jgi:hypothetical protein